MAAQKDVSDAVARLDKLKQTAKRSIESSSNTYVYSCFMSWRHYTQNRLAELRTGLASLKSRSEESFAFAAQAHSTLPDIRDLRVAIKVNSESPHKFVAFSRSESDVE